VALPNAVCANATTVGYVSMGGIIRNRNGRGALGRASSAGVTDAAISTNSYLQDQSEQTSCRSGRSMNMRALPAIQVAGSLNRFYRLQEPAFVSFFASNRKHPQPAAGSRPCGHMKGYQPVGSEGNIT
jgi:hypothetical protein